MLAKAANKKYRLEYYSNNKEIPLRDGALAILYMDIGLTRSTYEDLRSCNLMLIGAKFYQTYGKNKEAKADCYPSNISVSEISVSEIANRSSFTVISPGGW